MKLKLTKPLIFISGFVVGVCTAIVVALYHDIMSMQPQPVVEQRHYVTFGPNKPDEVGRVLSYMVNPLDDTQPVYIGEPDGFGAWQLEQFAKESE